MSQPTRSAAPTPGDHPLRTDFSEMMHLRILPMLAPPVRLRQWLVLQDAAARAGVPDWLATIGVPADGAAMGRHVAANENGTRIWEQHSEFATITEIRSGAEPDPVPPSPWLNAMPGSIFRSIEIVILPRGAAPPPRDRFDPARLVCADLFDGAARMWSDYTLKEDHTGRIWIEDLALANDEPSRLVQTLIEVGNYRKLALLGFPVARALLPWLDRAEERHAALTRALSGGGADAEALLAQLTALATEVEDQAAAIRFRMGATFSYQRLTLDRIEALREDRIAGYSGAAEFIERRLLPAIRTCEVVDRRLTDLSERISRTCSLLGLQQNIALERQNQAILSNLNRRARLQVRLQGLVEGLSVFAVSYYVLGLLAYALGPLGGGEGKHGAMPIWLLAAATPLVLLGVWLGLKLVKRSAHHAPHDED